MVALQQMASVVDDDDDDGSGEIWRCLKISYHCHDTYFGCIGERFLSNIESK